MTAQTCIQIYCRRPSLGEMKELLDLGVEYIAWHVHPEDGSALTQSRLIADLVRDNGATSSLLVHSRKPSMLEVVAKMVVPDFLLLSSDRDDAAMPGLSAALGGRTRLMMSIPVRPAGTSMSLQSKELARNYQDFAGALILDTCPDPSATRNFGCTGRTNDWEICAEIVANSNCPVILAGGLDPGNVASSINAVRPFGVDACTSLEMSDKSKNLAACQQFVRAVREG